MSKRKNKNKGRGKHYPIVKYNRIDPVKRKMFLADIIAKSKSALPDWVVLDYDIGFKILENALETIVTGYYPLPVLVQQIIESADRESSATDIDSQLAGVIVQIGIFEDVIL